MPARIPTYRPPGRPPAGDRRPAHREYNATRRDPALLKLYSTARWREFRAWIRSTRMFCERCRPLGRMTPGEAVHHLVDPRDDLARAFDPDNVELLCKSCHSRHHAAGGKSGGSR